MTTTLPFTRGTPKFAVTKKTTTATERRTKPRVKRRVTTPVSTRWSFPSRASTSSTPPGPPSTTGGRCMPMDPGNGRDVVAALELTDGAHDVDLVAEAPGGLGVVAVGLAGDCANPLASERACGGGFPGPMNVRIARLRVHALAAGTYPVFVWTDRDQKVLLHVTLGAPSSPPANETCGSALPLTPGTKVVANLVGARPDLASRCGVATGDLVYQVTLATRSIWRSMLLQSTATGTRSSRYARASCTGAPPLNLDAGADARSDAAVIVRPPDELACAVGAQASLVARALAAGTYYVAVSASAPTDVQLEATSRAPSGCPTTRPVWGRLRSLSIAQSTSHWATTAMTSIYRARRVARSTRLMRSISRPPPMCCWSSASRTTTRGGSRSLAPPAISSPTPRSVAAARHRRCACPCAECPAGSYRAVVESSHRNDVQLTALVRPSVAPSLVPFADTCSSALLIDESGGFFQGNTDNAQGDYSAGCDASRSGRGRGARSTAQARFVFEEARHFQHARVRVTPPCSMCAKGRPAPVPRSRRAVRLATMSTGVSSISRSTQEPTGCRSTASRVRLARGFSTFEQSSHKFSRAHRVACTA